MDKTEDCFYKLQTETERAEWSLESIITKKTRTKK